MSTTDPISDMLTSLRNATRTGLPAVQLIHSRLKSDIARVLKSEGYIHDFKVEKQEGRKSLVINLKGGRSEGALQGLKRVSTPGRRRYVGTKDVPRVLGGMGICILSTSQGVMSGNEARRKKVGGELLCQIW